MDIVFLMLLWLGIGACVGLIASVANLRPATWQSFGWLRMVIVGMSSAFCGGWLAIFFFGQPFTIPMALWISVVGVVCIPRLMQHVRVEKAATVSSKTMPEVPPSQKQPS